MPPFIVYILLQLGRGLPQIRNRTRTDPDDRANHGNGLQVQPLARHVRHRLWRQAILWVAAVTGAAVDTSGRKAATSSGSIVRPSAPAIQPQSGGGHIQPQCPIRLLATDLDGTLVGNGEGGEELFAFRQLLVEIRSRWNTQWAIITGRHMSTMRGVLVHFLCAGLSPDFVVLEDARIYRHVGNGRLLPYWWWNFLIGRRRRRMVRRWRHDAARWRDELIARFPGTSDFSRKGIYVWICFSTLGDAVLAESVLRQKTESLADFWVFRWGTEVSLIPSVGTKGEAVKKLAHVTHIDAANILTIGYGVNDVSMLNVDTARFPDCVGNAVPQVKEAVKAAGGYIARQSGMKGVIETLHRHVDPGSSTSGTE